jgi:hypothetical protein
MKKHINFINLQKKKIAMKKIRKQYDRKKNLWRIKLYKKNSKK